MLTFLVNRARVGSILQLLATEA